MDKDSSKNHFPVYILSGTGWQDCLADSHCKQVNCRFIPADSQKTEGAIRLQILFLGLKMKSDFFFFKDKKRVVYPFRMPVVLLHDSQIKRLGL